MFFFLIDESFDCFFQKIKIAHAVDPDVPEGQELALAPHHTHEKSDPGQDTGRLHTCLSILALLTHKS